MPNSVGINVKRKIINLTETMRCGFKLYKLIAQRGKQLIGLVWMLKMSFSSPVPVRPCADWHTTAFGKYDIWKFSVRNGCIRGGDSVGCYIVGKFPTTTRIGFAPFSKHRSCTTYLHRMTSRCFENTLSKKKKHAQTITVANEKPSRLIYRRISFIRRKSSGRRRTH